MRPQHPLARTRRARLGVLAAGLVAIALLLSAHASVAADGRPIHPTLREFMPTGKYVFDASITAPRPAVYFSQRAAAYLVRGTPLGLPVLVRTGTATVESFPEDKIVCRPDGGCDVAADVKTTSLGTFRQQGTEMVIDVPGLAGRLKPRPPLSGWIKASDLRSAQPEYERDARKYVHDDAALGELRAVKGEVRIFVYFGSWCTTCNMLMGRILYLERALSASESPGTNVAFDFYAAPNVPRFYDDPEIKSGRIDKLPTGLVYVDGNFVGKIVSTAWTRPEVALKNLLAPKK